MVENVTLVEPQPTYSQETGEVSPRRLFNSVGMNPRMVRFYLLEKGIDLPREEVDLVGGENRRSEYLQMNPAAIMEYLEELHPEPPLIGSNAEERAVTRMWWRRVEIGICRPMVLGFYYGEGLGLFDSRIKCYPEQAEAQKEIARTGMRWLEGVMNEPWLAGERFTTADICLYSYIDQLSSVGQAIPDDLPRLNAWFRRVGDRRGAEPSLSKELPMGMRC